jgi:rhamnosyltransferase
MKLAGIVTLYYPGPEVIDHILSYLTELDYLYIFDNSEKPDSNIQKQLASLPNIQYISYKKNMGISYVLNYALKKSQLAGYEFLLTMDQDSSFPNGTLGQYKRDILKYEHLNPSTVGMYCVYYTGSVEPNNKIDKIRNVDIAITSGSILPVNLAVQCGGFDENLFIDEVDSEYCYRVKQKGLKIVEFPRITLNHSLGNPTKHCIFGYCFTTCNHNALRRYYITRNKIYVAKRYPQIRWRYIKSIIREDIFILLGEKNKTSKIYMSLKGLIDGILNHMGKYPTT